MGVQREGKWQLPCSGVRETTLTAKGLRVSSRINSDKGNRDWDDQSLVTPGPESTVHFVCTQDNKAISTVLIFTEFQNTQVQDR